MDVVCVDNCECGQTLCGSISFGLNLMEFEENLSSVNFVSFMVTQESYLWLFDYATYDGRLPTANNMGAFCQL